VLSVAAVNALNAILTGQYLLGGFRVADVTGAFATTTSSVRPARRSLTE
jgi:hypothetical protein